MKNLLEFIFDIQKGTIKAKDFITKYNGMFHNQQFLNNTSETANNDDKKT